MHESYVCRISHQVSMREAELASHHRSQKSLSQHFLRAREWAHGLRLSGPEVWDLGTHRSRQGETVLEATALSSVLGQHSGAPGAPAAAAGSSFCRIWSMTVHVAVALGTEPPLFLFSESSSPALPAILWMTTCLLPTHKFLF